MNAKTFCFLALISASYPGKGQQPGSLNMPGQTALIDPIEHPVSHHHDSLLSISGMDSIAKEVHHHLDSGIAVLNKVIDSLNAVVNSPDEYKWILGDLYEEFDSVFLSPIKLKADSVSNDVRERVNYLQSTLERKKDFMDSLLTAKLSLKALKPDTRLPDPGLRLQDIPSLTTNQLSSLSPGMIGTQLADLDFPNAIEMDRVIDIENSLGKVGEMTQEIKVYADEISKVKNGDLVDMDKVNQRVERRLLNSKEMTALKNGSASISKLEKEAKGLANKMKDKDKLKEEVMKRSSKKFVDHFAGQEDKIKSEIRSMEKLQRKYHSVTDVRYLPKRRTNPEKGKPFVERMIIGTEFQIDRKDPKWTGMDVSPYLGYKFSDRFRMSIGGTYRVTFDTKTLEFTQEHKVFGFRTFANYRILSGWFGHLEAETLKMKVPPSNSGRSAAGSYEEPRWIPMAHVGIFKTFSISRHFQGQTQILYDFLNVDGNFHFNKIALRFGFEYKILKKVKK